MAEPPRIASLADVEVQIQKWPEKFISCRTMSHQWKIVQRRRFPQGYVLVALHCTRCSLIKKMEVSFGGHVYESWYDYPEGYLAKGLGRMGVEGRDMLRVASLLGTSAGPDMEIVGTTEALKREPRGATRRALAEED